VERIAFANGLDALREANWLYFARA
jgi:hypothetical protein